MVLEWILLILTLVTGALVWLGRLRKMPEGRSTLVDYGRSLFPVILIVFILRSFIVEPFRIPSGSMLPTLHLGDFILVNKAAYGLRLPIIYTKVVPTGAPERERPRALRRDGAVSLSRAEKETGGPPRRHGGDTFGGGQHPHRPVTGGIRAGRRAWRD